MGAKREIVAWDGEGLDEDDRHRYALLACAYGDPEGQIHHVPDIRRREGLRCTEMLDLINRMGMAKPQAYHIMFGAGYDWDHWVRELEYDSAVALAQGHPIVVPPFTIRSNGVWFEVSSSRTVTYVWDMWKFWGQGFEPALRSTFPDFHGLDVITKFKEARGRFTWDQWDEVAHYNRLELEGLIKLAWQFFEDLESAGIPEPSLTGAGALAGALFKKHKFTLHVGDPHFGDPRVEDAVLRGFSAGRIDPWQIGYVPFRIDPAGTRLCPEVTVHQHDLVSAYPSAMCDLPSMAEGRWEWRDGEPDGNWDERMSVWLVRWNYVPGLDPAARFDQPPTRRYYPFFYRTRQGNILYPPAGVGWQMWPEVVMARALGWKFQVVGGWTWWPADPLARPMSWVPLVFHKRLQLKDAGREGPQRVLKYALNSLYGKMCQSRGATYLKPPPYQNLAMAAWTTSHCRAKIMEAAHQAPELVLFQMTDSVVSLEQLDVPLAKRLGAWEYEERSAAVVAQAGVGSTWDMEGREWRKYRGFDPNVITSDAILRAWEDNHRDGWPHPLECTVRRPVTLAQAVQTAEAFEDFGNWLEQPRELNLYGGDGKRTAGMSWDTMRPWLEPCPLEPAAAYYADDHVPMSLPEIEAYCLSMDKDPISAPYRPNYAEQDPYSLAAVEGRWRQAEEAVRDA